MYRVEPDIPLSELEKVQAPTLVIMGQHDIPTIEHAQEMQRTLPNGRLEVVPDASHGLPMEKPEVVSRLVLDFLQGAPGRTG